MVNEEEFKEWQVHPVTRAVMEWLQAARAAEQAAWAAGQFTSDTIEKSAMLNAEAIGRISAFQTVLGVDLEDLGAVEG